MSEIPNSKSIKTYILPFSGFGEFQYVFDDAYDEAEADIEEDYPSIPLGSEEFKIKAEDIAVRKTLDHIKSKGIIPIT